MMINTEMYRIVKICLWMAISTAAAAAVAATTTASNPVHCSGLQDQKS